MSFEDTIATLLEAKLAPLAAELRKLRAELEAVRRAIPPVLVTMPDAAERLGISLSTVRRRVRDGSLPSRRLGSGRVVRVDLSRVHVPAEEDVIRLAHAAKCVVCVDNQ